ncbi:alpha/beta hydrolase family protein [Sungkyunkwania multivorans]|uniref:Alpha/beta hydrolase family protein n=1 Tax=Sungkyunkwania multivorans TaxID=1173618 RepID=A0ABW3CTT7_9FLAO
MIHLVKILVFFLVSSCFAQIEIAEEEITIFNDSIRLPGTLSYPQDVKNPPLVIFVHGSGQSNRNGTPLGSPVSFNYIKEFGEALNNERVAVFRYDKRSSTTSNYQFSKDTKIADLAADLSVIIEHFKKDKRFETITVIGHSQGSLLGMITETKPDKFVSLAGAGETIDKTIIRQVGSQSPVFGEMTKQYIAELKEKGTVKNVNPMLRTLFNDKGNAFLRDWIAYDPTEEIQKLSIPVLIIQGEMDSQVQVEDAENLKEAKPDAELRIIPTLNHLLYDVKNTEENQRTYTGASFPISQEMILTIKEFINK